MKKPSVSLPPGSVNFQCRLEQLAPQNASQAKDARTEQHDAAGLRNRAGAGCGRLANRGAAQDGEGFRRNGSNRILRSRGRAAVLIPVDRIASVDDRVLQVEPVGAGVQVDRAEGAGLGANVKAELLLVQPLWVKFTVPSKKVVPPNSAEVMETSADSRMPPGNSQAAKSRPLTEEAEPNVNVSLTMKPKLMVQASTVPLGAPLS